MVRLKALAIAKVGVSFKFQFQNGTIKSHDAKSDMKRDDVSIPKWYD